jgi:hypothetical protein
MGAYDLPVPAALGDELPRAGEDIIAQGVPILKDTKGVGD